eukprot:6221729-Prymnesium_polylepis.1
MPRRRRRRRLARGVSSIRIQRQTVRLLRVLLPMGRAGHPSRPNPRAAAVRAGRSLCSRRRWRP